MIYVDNQPLWPVEDTLKFRLDSLGLDAEVRQQFITYLEQRFQEHKGKGLAPLSSPEMVLTMRMQVTDIQLNQGEGSLEVEFSFRGWPQGWTELDVKSGRTHAREVIHGKSYD